MRKINNALSNDVYENENQIFKKIRKSDFKEIMCLNEVEIIKKYDHRLILHKFSENEIIMNKLNYYSKSKYSKNDILLIADELKRFHKINISNKKITPFMSAYKFLGGKNELELITKILERNPVLLHNDLVNGNILFNKNEIVFIDFEYSWYGNEIFDIASFITENKLSKEMEEIFIKQFKINEIELKLVKEFLNEFWALWAINEYKKTNRIEYLEIYNDKIINS